MKTVSQEKVELILDILYHNSDKTQQKSFHEIARQAKLSYNPVRKVIAIMQNMHILIVEGTRKNTTYRWAPDRAGVNPSMIRKVYELYTGGEMIEKSVENKLTVEKAVNFLIKHGWSGRIEKSYREGIKILTEVIELD